MFFAKRQLEPLEDTTVFDNTRIELWYFGCLPSPVRLVWAAGRPGLPLLLWAILRMFSQPFAEVHWQCCEELGGWRRRLAGSRQFKSKYIGKDVSPSHTHTHAHTVSFFICSCFIQSVCQKYIFKQSPFVQAAKLSVQLIAHFLTLSSLHSLNHHNQGHWALLIT